eukprot:1355903-Rhodomonas_salina.1
MLNEVRTRTRVAAAKAGLLVQQDQDKIQEERPAGQAAVPLDAAENERVEPPLERALEDKQEQIAREQEEAAALTGGATGGIYFDEANVVFCGFAATGDKKAADILPDPQSWEEAMNQPDWKEWVKASKEER